MSSGVFHSFKKVQNQYLVAICGSILGFLIGCIDGWVSPALMLLISSETPLVSGPLTLENLTWIGSIGNVGIAIGNISYLYIGKYFGRKLAVSLLAVPAIICWALIYWGTLAAHVILSQLIGGMVIGGTLFHVPLFVAEVSDDNIRGILSTFLNMLYNIGVFGTFIIATYLSYRTVALVFLILPFIFFFLFIWMPETPQFLLHRNKVKAAENSVRFYKNCYDDAERFKEEWSKVEEFDESASIFKEKLNWRDLWTPQARYAFANGANVIVCTKLSALLLLNYISLIIKDSGANIDPNQSSIFVAGIQVIGAMIATVLVDKAGRRLLIAVSMAGTAVGQFIVGAFVLASRMGIDVTPYSWIPVAGLGVIFFFASIGLMPLRYIIVMEMLPPKIRAIGLNIAIYFAIVVLLVASKAFPIVYDKIGLDFSMFFMSAIMTVGLILCVGFLPETKGKNLNLYQEI